MFINVNKENCFLIFFEIFPKHVKVGWKFLGTLKLSVYLIHLKIFFHELKTFQTSYLSIINYLQLFNIFSIFLFLLILFKFTSLWIAIYLIGHHWLCLIFSVWLHRNSYFRRKKKKMQPVNSPLFSVLGRFHLSQNEISKDLTKIATDVNVSRD